MPATQPFHLAFPVNDLAAARAFYVDVLGCRVGRTDSHWIDFDFWGHQVVAHLSVDMPQPADNTITNTVDGKHVPTPHFGVVLQWDDWHALAARLKAADTDFLLEPYIRFEGLPGEQATLFIRDPSGNALEFKSFKDMSQLFATD